MRSVTKSIVGLLYGIALEEGRVPALEEPIVAQFPEYPDLASDPQRKRLTIRHTLSMTLAMEWKENAPYTDAANSEIAMEQAQDRYRFILDRPILAEPGRGWIYSGGAVALLGEIIERGTGQSLPAFASEKLFSPLRDRHHRVDPGPRRQSVSRIGAADDTPLACSNWADDIGRWQIGRSLCRSQILA
ncbi:serine hydrolase domain-containing protein [Rhizobium beringeri]